MSEDAGAVDTLADLATAYISDDDTTLGRISGGNATQNQGHWHGRGPKLGGRF